MRAAGAYEAVYKHAHGAPHRIAQFSCAVPGAPRCTAALRMSRIRAALRRRCCSRAYRCSSWVSQSRDIFVAGVTGSTGSGRTPGAGTHHPQRHSDLYAYNPLSHRHTPEIKALARDRCGRRAPSSTSCRTPDHSRAASTSPCRRRRSARSRRRNCSTPCASSIAANPSCALQPEMPHIKDVATSNYAYPERRGEWRDDRSDVRDRQSHEGRRGRRHPVAEPYVRLRRDDRPLDAGGGMDVRRK